MEYYQVHKAASLVPLAGMAEQEALKDDIKANGQQQPISLYRGKIVDGRCRQNACIELGIGVDAKELPNNMSMKEVESYVKSVNTRRNLTVAQKAITAMKEMERTGDTNITNASKRWGVSRADITNAIYINKEQPRYIEPLFNGLKIEYKDAKTGEIKKGTSLYPIRKAIEAETKEFKDSLSYSASSNTHMAIAFEQTRLIVKAYPKELTPKEIKYILKKVAEEIKE